MKLLEQQLAEFEKRQVKRVKLAITDIDGVMRGKYISLKKFKSLAPGTGGFCDCVFGWDVADVLYENDVKFTGWHTAYPDAKFKIDLTTMRWLEEEHTPFYIADFVSDDEASFHPVCPRNALKKVLSKAYEMGLDFNLAFEYEFFLFNETPH